MSRILAVVYLALFALAGLAHAQMTDEQICNFVTARVSLDKMDPAAPGDICALLEEEAQSSCHRMVVNAEMLLTEMRTNSSEFPLAVADNVICPYITEPELLGGCSFWEKAGCAVAIAGAIAACGGPVNIPCVLAALRIAKGCTGCFCQSIGCPRLCKAFC